MQDSSRAPPEWQRKALRSEVDDDIYIIAPYLDILYEGSVGITEQFSFPTMYQELRHPRSLLGLPDLQRRSLHRHLQLV